jgi:hypothetical protein
VRFLFKFFNNILKCIRHFYNKNDEYSVIVNILVKTYLQPSKPPASLHLFLKVRENVEVAVQPAKAAPVMLVFGKNAIPVDAISQQHAMQSSVKHL